MTLIRDRQKGEIVLGKLRLIEGLVVAGIMVAGGVIMIDTKTKQPAELPNSDVQVSQVSYQRKKDQSVDNSDLLMVKVKNNGELKPVKPVKLAHSD